MLSAVENHYVGGPGRPYQHHFGGGQPGASLQMPPASAALSAAEFARPHPKPRYSGGSLRNGLTSPRSKYSEQSGPVNLAVSQSATAITLSLADENVASSSRRLSPGAIGATAENGGGGLAEHNSGQPQPSQQSQSSSINGLYCPPKLSFCPTSGGPTNGYQAAINYSSLYGRANTIYGTPTLYNSHLVGRSLHRPPYQLDSYSTYLPPVTYSAPGAIPPQMLPIVMSQPTAISSVQKSPGDSGIASSDSVHPLPPSPSISAAAKLVNDRSHTPQAPLQQQSLHHTQHTQPQQQLPLVLSSNNNSSGSSKTKEKLEGKVQSGHHQSHHHHNINNNSNISHNQNPITSNGKTVGFKVPSGKEGSLKHRILTRPYGEKDSKNRSSAIQGSVVRSSSNNNAPTNFTKGSLIELYNGELRRVEDMRTEDFISSSNKNPDLQLAETTVVKITPRPSNVMITFSYNNLKYDMESVTEHPYFVYGQGWASCDPDGSIRVFGLKCQRLQVGDVCISLTPRDSVLAQPQHGRNVSTSASSGHHQPSALPPQHVQNLQQQQQQHHHQLPPTLHQPLHPHQPPHHQPPSPQQAYYNNCVYNYCKDQVDQAQNLSRKPLPPQTVPTTATVTAVTSRPAPHFLEAMPESISTHPLHMHTTVSSYSAFSRAVDERRPHSNQSSSSSTSSSFRPTGSTLDDAAKHINDVIATNMTINLSNHVAQQSTGGRPLSNHAPTMYGASDMDDSVDVSLSSSRKRRWSAPDICEDEACQQSGQKCKH